MTWNLQWFHLHCADTLLVFITCTALSPYNAVFSIVYVHMIPVFSFGWKYWSHVYIYTSNYTEYIGVVLVGSLSCSGDVMVYVWHKPTKLAHFLFILFLRLFLSLWHFRLYFIPSILPTAFRLLTLFFQSYLCLFGPFNFVFLCESLLQPWYNPLWLTGLKAPTN